MFVCVCVCVCVSSTKTKALSMFMSLNTAVDVSSLVFALNHMNAW